MEYQFKSYSKGSKKKLLPSSIFPVLYLSWLVYFAVSLHLGGSIMLFEWFPKWTIIIVFAIFTGIIGGIWHPFFRPSKYVIIDYYWGGFLGFMLIIPTFNVLTYLSLDQTNQYQTEYDIVSPGPPRLKGPRCEYGIRLKEIYTGQWVSFCISDPKLKTKKNSGIVWVTAKTGPIGAYVVDYQFSPFNPE
ncbi:hypothetical protein [Providencia sp. PROV202]|uniref:hypothetical protein n=1 Tax=Providencia sp. PROV202 TaxID=2949902 RepID=UPI00234BD557|nr:hypothetical protein [Providencia sp. PROV202]